MKNVINGFKEFIMRGNVIDLAVGIVIGAAFSDVVNSLVNNFINPLIAAIFGKPDLSGVLAFKINNAQFSIGAIVGEILNFVFIAAAIYFFIVLPINSLQNRRKQTVVEEPEATPEDILLLSQIRDLLVAQNGGGTRPSTPPAPPAL